ncbi:aldehyde dehydrogenase family protein [Kineosporia rhizophila]|uniref:aldehyde dehydrogenase family protein n=1 Tax=Kineosporia TaxID=49184 RepID=UPI001E40DC8E|nr:MULTISPECIES: aldehyde dehydrogenase family protein [Kineosporia]MCE0538738.1 aldehyde dehydrogenase family protein [Kineosporia rhizophila]GLY19515.1 aldehyde dehydrogenase [Kineosporia sp. NBRC 101677]
MSGSTTETDLLDRVTAEGGREIFEPATGQLLGRAPQHSPEDLQRAVAAARQAQPAWEKLGHAERSARLLRMAERIEAVAEPLARLLAREQGKPLNGPNARFEVGACSAWLRATAATVLEDQVVVEDEQQVSTLTYRPVGLVAAVGPWNWPLMIAIWQIAPALRMGNVVVAKPSEFTPLSVLALVSILNEELPEGVLTALSGDRELGAALVAHPDVRKIMFTGSTATGRKIVEASGANLARLTLELGGNDAGIVLPDADPEAIAGDLFWGAFINTGQTCAALKRLYVHESIHDRVVEALAAVAAQMPLGPSLSEESVLGPVQNSMQFDIVAGLVQDARERGATIVTGGAPATELGPLFYPITLVTGLGDGAPLVDQEQFGPALPIIRYTEVEDAIASANRLDVGLGASVWSSDPQRAQAVADQLEAGTVWINGHGGVHPMAPFGGVKSSGYGLEFGVEGLKAVAVPKVVSVPKTVIQPTA